MLLAFFKNLNIFDVLEVENQENLELEEKEIEESLFEESLFEFFFMNTRIMKFFNIISHTLYHNKITVYNFFLRIRYNSFSNITFLLGQFEKNKFQWTNFNYIPYKSFLRIKPTFTTQLFFEKKNKLDEVSRIKRIIVFKKKNGLLKRRSKIKNFLLLKLNNLKNYKFLPKFLFKNRVFYKDRTNFLNKFFFKKENHFRETSKFLDFKKRWCKLFSTNRELLKTFSNVKKTKQFQITRNFMKFLKKKTKLNFIETEFSLLNMLIRSKMVFTVNEAAFFIKNNFVYVNGICITNTNHTILINDVVNIVLKKKYFFFTKVNFNKKLKLTYGLGYRLWRLNRFRNNFYKQSPTGIPEWIFKLSFFYEDVPSFLEVDYMTLTLTVIKLPNKFFNYNFFFTKFISFYLFRLYNWKYVI